MDSLPDGLVTFLFTDVESSTKLWEEAPDSMMEALRLHDDAIEGAVESHNGVLVKPRGEGDSRFVVFASGLDAIRGASDMQRRLAAVDWPTPRQLKVRASLHTGQAELDLGDYYGSAVNRAARLRSIAHGGQTVLSGSTYEVVRDHLPDGLSVTDMGSHRLKDLARPEHVYQLNVDGLDTSFPPLASLDLVSNNLPVMLTDLVGRDAELALVKQMLTRSRLVTVLAPGGTGKTHLAIQAAADLSTDFPDGVFFIALADISESSEIVQTVAETVGVSLSSEEDPETQLLDYLRPRRQLLVFDNFEHVIEGARILAEILHTAPDISAIATSRSKLGVLGEAVLPLDGLDTDWDDPESALQTNGVRLFFDAARRTRPDFSLGPEDVEPLALIMRVTEGMPLAILLAASWVDMLPIRDIAAEISKNLDFLETSAVDAPDRHRSIRAVFDYTWSLLTAEEQEMFAALSVFRGGFTREAAEAVAKASVRDLASLAAKSLVVSNADTGRYSVHELLRQYAEVELKDRPHLEARTRKMHAEFYADLAEAWFESFPASRQDQLLAAVDDDLENIRPAWRHHLASKDGSSIQRMVRCLWIVYEIHGWYQAGLSLFGDAREELDASDPEQAVPHAYLSAIHGVTLAYLGQAESALAMGEAAVEAIRTHGQSRDLFFALHLQAQILLYVARPADLTPIADSALEVAYRDGSKWPGRTYWAAGFKNLRAFAALAGGDNETARHLLEESREVLDDTEDLYYSAWNLTHRGRMALGAGQLDTGIDLLQRSADRARRLGFLRGLQVSSAALGDAYMRAGESAAAESALVESLDASERSGMVPEMLGTMVKIATVFAATGRLREAVELLATVTAEPMSARRVFTEEASTAAIARVELEKLQADLEPDEYEAALAAGSTKEYRSVAKHLVDEAKIRRTWPGNGS